MSNAKELFGLGAFVAGTLFLFYYYTRIVAADSMSESVEIFSRAIQTLIFTFVPTSEIAALISVTAGFIGSAISIKSLGPKLGMIIFSFGFLYTSTNLIIYWFTVSV
ncbi:hypothetical protein [Natrinema sp. DC36]|uniref:hypothetical protein n=1 Tax=Natrinema sp. DC36 TaxID=2878680 RepID=UPI001CEFB58A|nr:hypothetical protein [Natrinema sp. DC36]